MSLSWRSWVRINYKALGLTKEEIKIIESNMEYFCKLSDQLIREECGSDCLVNRVFDKMPQEQKEKFSEEVIRKGLRDVPKKKKKKQTEIESEEKTAVEEEMQEESIIEKEAESS